MWKPKQICSTRSEIPNDGSQLGPHLMISSFHDAYDETCTWQEFEIILSINGPMFVIKLCTYHIVEVRKSELKQWLLKFAINSDNVGHSLSRWYEISTRMAKVFSSRKQIWPQLWTINLIIISLVSMRGTLSTANRASVWGFTTMVMPNYSQNDVCIPRRWTILLLVADFEKSSDQSPHH